MQPEHIIYAHTFVPICFLKLLGCSFSCCLCVQPMLSNGGWSGFVTVVKYMDTTTGCWPFPNKFKDEYIIYITQDLPHMSTARAVGFLLRLLCCYRLLFDVNSSRFRLFKTVHFLTLGNRKRSDFTFICVASIRSELSYSQKFSRR